MTPRVVSLLPSATEIVCALGMEDALTGVSHECDHPPSVVGRPVLTSTRVRPSDDSRAIDADVRSVLRDALAVYDVDEEGLARARPDVIVTQDLCDVCAVSYDDVVAAAKRALGPEVRIVNLHPTRLSDIWDDVRRVGAALGRETQAAALLADMDARVDEVRRRAAVLSARPRTLTLEWLDPPMAGGTWMPELIAIAGGEPLGGEPGQPAPTLDPDAIAELRPDVVVVKPCGFDLARIGRESALLASLLQGVDAPAWIADGNAYFNRPGPRIVDSLEILAACLHPEAFGDLAERHEGCFLPLR